MLMTFSKSIYMERILSGVKIHTIRADPHKRWKAGMTAHMWMHSPRTVSKNPFQFAEAEVSYVVAIYISKENHSIKIGGDSIGSDDWEALEKVAHNDGFDSAADFFEWFGEFEGRLIFWKDLRRITA